MAGARPETGARRRPGVAARTPAPRSALIPALSLFLAMLAAGDKAVAQVTDLASYTCRDFLADKALSDAGGRDAQTTRAQFHIGLALAYLQGYASGWVYRPSGQGLSITSAQMLQRLRQLAATCRTTPDAPIATLGKAIAEDLLRQ